MPSTSEQSYGQRYTKARELVKYLEITSSYAPASAELGTADLSTFLETVDAANSSVASKLSALQTERVQRYNMFKTAEGLITRCAQIRDYIGAIHPDHKNATDYKKIQKAVQSMRGMRLSKKPIALEGGAAPKTHSVSERSYGSMLRVGKDVLEVIKATAGYTPSNTNLTIANFNTFLNQIDTANSSVAEKLEQYDNSVEERLSLYNQLDEKISKIKLSLAAQYGKSSNEYKDALKF